MPILQPRKIFEFVGVILAVELASFLSFDKPFATSFFFALICASTFILAWKNLGSCLLIAFGELFIGSQGYLFILERHGSHVPIRMGIFVMVMLVWLIKYCKWRYWKEQLKSSHIVQLFVGFMVIWTLGVILGFAHHNTFSNILNDSNAYLYWLLFLPVWQVREGLVPHSLSLLAASVITTTAKTAFAWYIFSKQIFSHDTLEFIYRWIRDTRVGEIVTYDRGGYVRVFFQSHIFELVGLFVFLGLIIFFIQTYRSFVFPAKAGIHNHPTNVDSGSWSGMTKRLVAPTLLASLCLATILMSLSRSFWLAGLVTFVLFNVFLLCQVLFKKINILSLTWRHIGLFLVSCFFIFFLAFGISTLAGATSLGSRATTKTEAALSSRWKLLPPLLAKTTEHPLLGSGFGTTVTYQSDDPRIKNSTNPDGWYTTYAFEWGYLDIITKIGAFGLAVYLIFLLAIFKEQWLKLRTSDPESKLLALGLCAGMTVLFATHTFTPYLNHPLGIGYLLLFTSTYATHSRKN